ncbi:MAG: hypothetical protein HZB70_03395 [Candidatus Berkelbacteria bacterium]|nr:MAG: hypothetical protein HZB70_03395 [Candidatus Berkelbacteria bacterium]QQG51653.1 MAG: hypothetical protein HY845_03795 [Candidatus Berkelbacteria bacterium]
MKRPHFLAVGLAWLILISYGVFIIDGLPLMLADHRWLDAGMCVVVLTVGVLLFRSTRLGRYVLTWIPSRPKQPK